MFGVQWERKEFGHMSVIQLPGFHVFLALPLRGQGEGGRRMVDWLAFGYGRQVCPGKFFATDIEIFLFLFPVL